VIVKNNIKAILEKQGKTQASLARALNTSDASIHRLVSGSVENCRVSTAIKLSDALGVDIRDIFELTNITKKGA